MWTPFDRYHFDPLALLGHVLLAAMIGLCAILFAVIYVPALLALWLLGLAWWVWRWQPPERPWLGAATQCVVVALIFTAGVWAPMKTTDRLLDEGRVRLPRPQMTLAELADVSHDLPDDWRPLWLHISEDEVTGRQGQQTIQFPATTMTVRQFVETVEAQTSLRRRFGHCGNCSTVLHGGSCTFGLTLRTPQSQ